MVDLSGGQDGPIEHRFSNFVFVISGIIFVSLAGVRDADAEEPVIREENLESVHSPMGDFKMPSTEKLLELLESMNMSEEDKEQVKQGLLKNIHKHLEGQDNYVQSTRILVVVLCVLAIISIFVFFGYRLYRSQTEKERKREEKKKQKQQKKKHK